MSQSAASGALKDLEQQFDLQLFDRIGKKLKLNDLGRLLRPRAESLLDRARELEREILGHQQAGHLKLGATLTIGNYLAVGLMAKFIQQVPGASISLEVANTAEIARQVLNFDLDVGLIEGELQDPNLEVMRWAEDELVVFCSPAHPWVNKEEITDQDLLEARWILRETGSGTRQAFDRAMHGLLPELQVSLELQHTEAIKRAVKENLGVSCLSRIALDEAFTQGSLVPVKLPRRDLHRNFYVILHRHKYRSESIEQWLALCQRFK
jgi:DNA-binding transcriptional LysR family regulator